MGNTRHYDNDDNVLVRIASVEAQTERAYKVTLSDDDTQGIWIPKSQVAHFDEDAGEVWIPLWLAEEKGLEYQ